MNREAVMLASDSQVPTDGFPAFKARLTGLGRITIFLPVSCDNARDCCIILGCDLQAFPMRFAAGRSQV